MPVIRSVTQAEVSAIAERMQLTATFIPSRTEALVFSLRNGKQKIAASQRRLFRETLIEEYGAGRPGMYYTEGGTTYNHVGEEVKAAERGRATPTYTEETRQANLDALARGRATAAANRAATKATLDTSMPTPAEVRSRLARDVGVRSQSAPRVKPKKGKPHRGSQQRASKAPAGASVVVTHQDLAKAAHWPNPCRGCGLPIQRERLTGRQPGWHPQCRTTPVRSTSNPHGPGYYPRPCAACGDPIEKPEGRGRGRQPSRHPGCYD